MDKKANFFIVGTPKAGTTSLYYYLEEHPEIYMSPIKETNHFSYKEIKEQGLYYNVDYVITPEAYQDQFSGLTNEKAVGEASVSYLFYASVPAQIKAYNPEARIIIVLRNPVDRGFSHYLMDKRLGFVSNTLEEIVDTGHDKNSQLNLFYQQFISLGCYYEQVKRYLDTFGKNQVRVFLYEDIQSDIDEVVKQIYTFLSVNDKYQPATDRKHNVFLAPKGLFIKKLYTFKPVRKVVKKLFGGPLQDKIKQVFFEREKKPILSPALKVKMQAIFKDDITKTAQLINRDLSHWLK